jgi:D-alanine-D-alanine ligase
VGAHRALGCRDLSRADFVVPEPGEGELTLLEVNTLPGFTATSLFPEAAAVSGKRMPELCDALVRAALARGPSHRNAPLPLPT